MDRRLAGLALALTLVGSCSTDPERPDGGTADSGPRDSGPRPDSGPIDAGVDVSELTDRFDGNTLDPSWSVLMPEAVTIAVSGGSLALEMRQGALWFNDSRGVLLHKPVAGDFKMSTAVRTRKASNGAEPPSSFVHLAGLMVRDPGAAAENYVFIVVGFDEDGLSVETKSTVDSMSRFVGPPWPSGDAELRLCRAGSKFLLYKRELGAASWTLAATEDRTDLPSVLQAGPNIYAFDSGAGVDLRATFDDVVFAPVTSEADCAVD